MATNNVAPQSTLNKSISFSTVDSNDAAISEPFTVIGPTNLAVIPITGGKAVIQVSPTNTNGSYFLKIHYPQSGSNTLYVTFAQKNSNYVDGYQDLSTIPTQFQADLKSWVLNGRTASGFNTYKRILNFSAVGLDTNKVYDSLMFQISFEYSHSVSTTTNTTSTTTTASASA